MKLIQNTLDNLQEWSNKSGLRFSKTKTVFIILTNKHKNLNNMNLKLNGENIKEVNQLRILGLIFDKKMSWKIHINKLKSECHQRLNILKILS